MSAEIILASEAQDSDRVDLPELMQILVERGEMEVVTTALGEVLYIRQSVDG